MSKTHAPHNPTRYEAAMASGDIRRVLMLKAACGARATERAQLDMTTNAAAVDCGRCVKTPAYRYLLAAADAAAMADTSPVVLEVIDHTPAAAERIRVDLTKPAEPMTPEEVATARAQWAKGTPGTVGPALAAKPKRIASFPTNTELVEIAKANAAAEGLPAPRTAEDVSTLTGFAYNGPDPEAVGVTVHPVVQRPEAPRPVGRPAVGKLRTVRVSDVVWEAAAAVAETKGETVSEVIRAALEAYAHDELVRRAVDGTRWSRRGGLRP